MDEINHGVILGSGTKHLYVGGTIPRSSDLHIRHSGLLPRYRRP